MLEFNERLLIEAGLFGLPSNITEFILYSVYQALELRVGNRIVGKVDDEKLAEVRAIMATKDGRADERTLAWLQANTPDYPDTVRDELRAVLNELGSHSSALRILLRS